MARGLESSIVMLHPLHHFGKETHDVIELWDWTMVHIASERDSAAVEVLPFEVGCTVAFNQIWEEADDGWLTASDVFVIVLGGFHFVIAIGLPNFLVRAVGLIIGG